MEPITSAPGRSTVNLLLIQCRAGGGSILSPTMETSSGRTDKDLLRAGGGLCLMGAPSPQVCEGLSGKVKAQPHQVKR